MGIDILADGNMKISEVQRLLPSFTKMVYNRIDDISNDRLTLPTNLKRKHYVAVNFARSSKLIKVVCILGHEFIFYGISVCL
jgi:hypothetical protein